MENIKKVIASYNYILIDMTEGINDLFDIDNKIIRKAHNFEKYKNVVFMISLKKIKNKTIIEYYQAVKILPEQIQKNTIMLYNKDNYIYFDLENQFNYTSIKKFIEEDENMSSCPICFEEKDNFNLCAFCSTSICLDCIVKINKPFCTICKKKHNDIIF